MTKMLRSLTFIFLLPLLLAQAAAAQPAPTTGFREVVDEIFEKNGRDFEATCPIGKHWAPLRVFTEYGAIFVAADSVRPPPKCIYESDVALDAFHAELDTRTEAIGLVRITLQRGAMIAFLKARKEAAERGLRITPRGGSNAASRTYSTTVALWNSRVFPGLAYWTRQRRIKAVDANAIRNAPIPQQIDQILALEREGIFFSTRFSKSILHSVAVPGASQHNFLLALDVAQFSNAEVRRILAENGWFQTVKSDEPHFTYLGLAEKDLPAKGLKCVVVNHQRYWIPNMDSAPDGVRCI